MRSFYCNKCGYHGSSSLHSRPNTGQDCGYFACKMTDIMARAVEVRAEAQEPYAYEYGHMNGDNSYSVVIERRNPSRPSPSWPVKPLYTTQQPPAPCPVCAALRSQRIRTEALVAEQRAEIERLNRGMAVYTEAFEAECQTTDAQSALIDLCEKALVIAYPNWEQYGDWEINAWARDTIAAIASHKKGIAQ